MDTVNFADLFGDLIADEILDFIALKELRALLDQFNLTVPLLINMADLELVFRLVIEMTVSLIWLVFVGYNIRAIILIPDIYLNQVMDLKQLLSFVILVFGSWHQIQIGIVMSNLLWSLHWDVRLELWLARGLSIVGDGIVILLLYLMFKLFDHFSIVDKLLSLFGDDSLLLWDLVVVAGFDVGQLVLGGLEDLIGLW